MLLLKCAVTRITDHGLRADETKPILRIDGEIAAETADPLQGVAIGTIIEDIEVPAVQATMIVIVIVILIDILNSVCPRRYM